MNSIFQPIDSASRFTVQISALK